MRQEQRKDEVSGKSKMTLDQCITDLLDEHTAQVNEGISQAMMADRVVVYVDDLLVFASLISSVDAAALLIGDRFAMRSLGPLHYYLGMRIIRDRSKRQIMIIQDGFLDSVALKFAQELAPLLPQTTPLGKTTADSLTIAAGEYEASTAIKMLYETLVGTAVWPVMISRPDCCYEVGLLCRFLKNPTPAHLDAIITVLRYLVGTKSLGMLFQGPTTGAGELNVHAFTESLMPHGLTTRLHAAQPVAHSSRSQEHRCPTSPDAKPWWHCPQQKQSTFSSR